MTGEIDNQERIDRIARALHAEAVERVPSHTLARLRPRPARAPAPRGWSMPVGWSLATACAAVFVLAIGVRGLAPDAGGDGAPPEVASAPAAPAAADPFEDPLIALEEDPDLFVWLASDARALAME